MNANKRTRANFIIDAIGYISFCILISTGIIMKYILLPGHSRRMNNPTTIWGISRHDWGDIHFWISLVFVTAIIAHLLLHWNWLGGVFQKILKSNSKYVIIPALVLPVLLAFLPVFGTQGFGVADEFGGGKRSNGSSYRSMESSSSPSNLNSDSGEVKKVGEGYENHNINGFMIRGRTTLQEIEQETGVKIEKIASALNLPKEVSKNERIAFLKDKYGLDMEKIRETIKQLALN